MSRRRSPRSGLATESASTAASPIDRAAAFARSRAAAPVAVGVLMLVSILARVWLARAVKTPWILVGRVHLLGGGQELRSERPLLDSRGGRPNRQLPLPGPDLAGLACRVDDDDVRARESDQRGPHDAGRHPGVLWGSPARAYGLYALIAVCADAPASLALLHRRADDGERVLPGLRNRRLSRLRWCSSAPPVPAGADARRLAGDPWRFGSRGSCCSRYCRPPCC